MRPLADHRVGERVRLGGRHAPEVDGHAERGELVVGDLAARVAEDQLGDLLRRRAPPRSASARSARPGGSRLAGHEDAVGRARLERLGQLGDAVGEMRASRRRGDEVDHRASRSGKTTVPFAVAPLDLREVRSERSLAVLVPERQRPRSRSPPRRSQSSPHVGAPSRGCHEPPAATEHACQLAQRRDRDRARGRAPSSRATQSNSPSANGSSWTSATRASMPAGSASARPSAARCRRRRPRAPSSVLNALRELAHPAADVEERARARPRAPPRRRRRRGSTPSVSSR